VYYVYINRQTMVYHIVFHLKVGIIKINIIGK